MAFTSDDLIERVKLWGMLPDDQATFTTARYLQLLNDELTMTVAPFITNIREEYFVEYEDTAIDVNEQEYSIPINSVGMSLRDVVVVDSNGNEASIPRFALQEKQQFYNGISPYNAGRSGFYLIKNKIKLPNPQSFANMTLRMYYYRRPDELVLSESGALITNITGSNPNYTITVDGVPSTWTSTARTYSINSGEIPFDNLNRSVTFSVTGQTFAYTGTLPDGVEIGNWITLPNQCVIPQLPIEAINYLCQCVVVRCLVAMGQGEENSSSFLRKKEMEELLKQIMSPRIDGEQTPFKGNPSIWSNL